jgi:hypothetical protein
VTLARVYSDDYEAGLDGEQIYPIESKSIRMARERVEIFVGGFEEDHFPMHVVGEFVLVNDTEEPVSILVAFPGLAVKEFERSVDDQGVRVTEYGDRSKSNIAYVSRVEFEPRQVRRVRVRYTAESDSRHAIEHEWSYILKTGAHWKGRIGEARVTVHFPMYLPSPGVGPYTVEAVSIRPKGYKAEGQMVTWVFKDFKPSEDIVIRWEPERLINASNPMALASKEEAPGMIVQLARNYSAWTGWANRKRAVQVLEDLRRAFPDSHEARTIDYEIARIQSNQYLSGRSFEDEGDDRRAAIGHYEAALKEPLTEEQRTNALCQLFLLHSKDVPDPTQANRILSLLKGEKLLFTFNRTLLETVAAVSPRAGLDLLDSMSFGVNDDSDVRAFRTGLTEKLRLTLRGR